MNKTLLQIAKEDFNKRSSLVDKKDIVLCPKKPSSAKTYKYVIVEDGDKELIDLFFRG